MHNYLLVSKIFVSKSAKVLEFWRKKAQGVIP